MLRGEIRLVNLDPVIGAEANKTRPAVIVGNDGANATAGRLGRGVVTAVPVTSNVARVHPFQIRLPARTTGLRTDSKAQAEPVRSVAVARPVPGSGAYLPTSWDSSTRHFDPTSRCRAVGIPER